MPRPIKSSTPAPHLLHIATATTRRSTSWQTKEITWQQLIERCQTPLRTPESVAQYFAMPKEKQGEAKDHGGFVGGTLKGKRRTKENVASRDLITLDLDHAEPGFWQKFTRTYIGTAAFCYSTHSHTPTAPRLRLIIPLEHSIEPAAYEPIARSIADDLGIEQFDDTTYDASRLMYFPSCPADGEYFFEVQQGRPINPEAILSGYDDWHDAEQWPTSSREAKRTISSVRKQEDPTTKEGIIGDFCRLYSVPDAIEKFLSEIYAPGTQKNRYTYIPGTTTNGLVIYEEGKFAHAFQSTDPLCGPHSYNAFDLVRLHLFGKYDKEKDLDYVVTDRPSWKKMVSFVYQDKDFQAAQRERQLDSARSDFSDVKTEEEIDTDAWKESLNLTKEGKIKTTPKNFLLLLANLPEFRGKLLFDKFENRIKVDGRLPWDKYDRVEASLRSDDYDLINSWFAERYEFNVSRTNLLSYVMTVAKKRERHPVRDYLECLRWDGIPRLDTLFVDFLAVPDTPINRAMTRKHLVAAVKRIYHPGCQYDNVVIFTGDQGAGKSTMVRKLGGIWAKPLGSKFTGRESAEQLQGGWLFESGEMRGWRGVEIEAIKDFFTRTVDWYRPAYGMTTNSYPRQCIFFATTNDTVFLNDATGNRRFWPLEVKKNKAKLSLWEDFTPDYRDQVWAEAVMRYREGEETFLNLDEEKDLIKLQISFSDTYIDDLADKIREYLEIRLPEDWYNHTFDYRVTYFRFHEYDTDLTASLRRDKVCYREIRTECFSDGRYQNRTISLSDINLAFAQIQGWEKIDGNTSFGRAYGRQRYFQRIVDPLDDIAPDTL